MSASGGMYHGVSRGYRPDGGRGGAEGGGGGMNPDDGAGFSGAEAGDIWADGAMARGSLGFCRRSTVQRSVESGDEAASLRSASSSDIVRAAASKTQIVR